MQVLIFFPLNTENRNNQTHLPQHAKHQVSTMTSDFCLAKVEQSLDPPLSQSALSLNGEGLDLYR